MEIDPMLPNPNDLHRHVWQHSFSTVQFSLCLHMYQVLVSSHSKLLLSHPTNDLDTTNGWHSEVLNIIFKRNNNKKKQSLNYLPSNLAQ